MTSDPSVLLAHQSGLPQIGHGALRLTDCQSRRIGLMVTFSDRARFPAASRTPTVCTDAGRFGGTDGAKDRAKVRLPPSGLDYRHFRLTAARRMRARFGIRRDRPILTYDNSPRSIRP